VAMSDTTRAGGTWGEAALAGLPHVLFPLIAAISPIARYLKLVQINEDTAAMWAFADAAMLAFPGVIVVMLIFAWRRRWPRWAASWIGYGLIIAWIAPFGLGGGYTVTSWLASQMPTALANLFFFAQILLSFGVGFLLAGRDRLSGLLVALPAVPMCWAWVDSEAAHSALGLPPIHRRRLSDGAGRGSYRALGTQASRHTIGIVGKSADATPFHLRSPLSS
jgi:hypothetical protein